MESLIAGFIFTQIADFYHDKCVKNFLVKSLYQALQDSKLQGQCVEQTCDCDSICLEVTGDKQSILAFSENLAQYVPLSLQWAFKEMVLLDSFSTERLLHGEDLPNSGFLTPLETQKISQNDTQNFCDLWGKFVDFAPTKMTLLDKNERITISNASELRESLQKCAQWLKSGERIFIKSLLGKWELALLDEKAKTTLPACEELCFMPFCLDNAKMLFRAENEDLQALATLEKPFLTLSPKSVFAEFFTGNFVKVILPYDPYLLLLSKFLDSFCGLYLLPLEEKRENGICVFVESQLPKLTISVAKNGLVLPHTFAPNTTNVNLKSVRTSIQTNALERVNALYLGRNATRFLLYFNTHFKEALDFRFESNLYHFITALESQNQTTQSLLKNFTEHNAALIQTLKSLPKDSKISDNLLDLIGMAGVLLNLGSADCLRDSAYALLQNAAIFIGQKGPRIDFRLERDKEGKIYLDTLQTLRSVMSFKLAGVETALLCFGILDSLAEFFANLSRDMEENYQTQGIVICGEMFLNKQFLNQFLHYLPQNSAVFACEVMEFV